MSARQTPTPWTWRRRLKAGLLSILALTAVTGTIGIVYALYPRTMPQTGPIEARLLPAEIERLRSVSDFDGIADPASRSVAFFEEAGRVLEHPRCLNCHPRTDRPTQTDAMRPHTPWVTRGLDGGGASTLRCSTCHQAENFAASGVPGNPKWKLAPIEMAWQGQTLGNICRQLLDPTRSHMTRDELLHHVMEDELVGWAWHPGGNRQPAPGTQQEFGSLIKAWLETGAVCPQ
ncbi:Isoquinoline 1-oxidoreductase subunit [Neorhizobium sp. DAR64872/K0K18]|uniref:Isoquinoline 1-oxidoreductase subunit n=1 Tax=Neorhizobium sp. DAR64872/K0K18 TaxID=3421958 RepID=UPI003D2733AD